ncbi:MAG: phosphoglucosamine mutase [Bacteroidetes bacterium]|nr:phosphoglucosamine mutase [Bacteroidota bacterium]
MTLIKSISGIRGTIGGKPGEGMNPLDLVKFTSAFSQWVKLQSKGEKKLKVVVGRDARISGDMLNRVVTATFSAMGINVVDIGLATTPTCEIAVQEIEADGGIILTASHNPKQWNALKLLNNEGEFLSDLNGKKVLELAEIQDFDYAKIDDIGEIICDYSFTKKHIDKILALELVDREAIKNANFKIAIDCVNSVGGIAIPQLLDALGVQQVEKLYCEPNGIFPHNPEPLPENLTELSNLVVEKKVNLGFVVDPDVDRLAIVNEDGTMFGEEYTLVAVADYVLSKSKSNTVSNLSSTRALQDVTEKHGKQYFASAVGEVNVVNAMKKHNATIGGEGNGGGIFPELHYGRDALVGIALFLSQLAKSGKKCSELRKTYPNYFISKNKMVIDENIDADAIFTNLKEKYSANKIIDIDGIRIDFDQEWVQIRKSNTEPIIRIYAESTSEENADSLAQKIIEDIQI